MEAGQAAAPRLGGEHWCLEEAWLAMCNFMASETPGQQSPGVDVGSWVGVAVVHSGAGDHNGGAALARVVYHHGQECLCMRVLREGWLCHHGPETFPALLGIPQPHSYLMPQTWLSACQDLCSKSKTESWFWRLKN